MKTEKTQKRTNPVLRERSRYIAYRESGPRVSGAESGYHHCNHKVQS